MSSSPRKFGAHVFLWQDGYDDSALLRIFDSAVRLGLSFVEIAVGDGISFDSAKLSAEAAARKLELVTSPGGEWPVECDISLPNSSDRAGGMEWHRREIDRAAELGAVAYAGAIYGHPGTVRRGAVDADEFRRIADGLHELAQYAAERNVQLVIEPMSHFRTHVANTPGQINELIALADHENLSSLLDTYHLTTEVTNMTAAFEEMRPRLWGLHACENNRGAPGTGLLPWQSLGRSIRESGWNGHIGFEGYNSTWRGGAFARERGMFHNVCPNVEAFIRESMRFMESILSGELAGAPAAR